MRRKGASSPLFAGYMRLFVDKGLRGQVERCSSLLGGSACQPQTHPHLLLARAGVIFKLTTSSLSSELI